MTDETVERKKAKQALQDYLERNEEELKAFLNEDDWIDNYQMYMHTNYAEMTPLDLNNCILKIEDTILTTKGKHPFVCLQLLYRIAISKTFFEFCAKDRFFAMYEQFFAKSKGKYHRMDDDEFDQLLAIFGFYFAVEKIDYNLMRVMISTEFHVYFTEMLVGDRSDIDQMEILRLLCFRDVNDLCDRLPKCKGFNRMEMCLFLLDLFNPSHELDNVFLHFLFYLYVIWSDPIKGKLHKLPRIAPFLTHFIKWYQDAMRNDLFVSSTLVEWKYEPLRYFSSLIDADLLEESTFYKLTNFLLTMNPLFKDYHLVVYFISVYAKKYGLQKTFSKNLPYSELTSLLWLTFYENCSVCKEDEHIKCWLSKKAVWVMLYLDWDVIPGTKMQKLVNDPSHNFQEWCTKIASYMESQLDIYDMLMLLESEKATKIIEKLMRLIHLVGKLVNAIHLSSSKHMPGRSPLDYDEQCAKVVLESGLLRYCCKVYFKYENLPFSKEMGFRFLLIYLSNNILFQNITMADYEKYYCDQFVAKFIQEAIDRENHPQDFDIQIKNPLLPGMMTVLEPWISKNGDITMPNDNNVCRYCKFPRIKSKCDKCKFAYCDDFCLGLDHEDYEKTCFK